MVGRYGPRQPQTDAAVAAVRRLIEQTTLTYAQIERQTGVGRASICRWTRDQNWQRPPFAPRATDRVPRARASARLKRRLLAGRISAIAERYVRELEESPGIDLRKLAEALMLARLAKLAARSKRRRSGNARAFAAGGRTALDYEDIHTLVARLRAAGIDPDATPKEAMQLYVEAHQPERDYPELRPRGRWSKGRKR